MVNEASYSDNVGIYTTTPLICWLQHLYYNLYAATKLPLATQDDHLLAYQNTKVIAMFHPAHYSSTMVIVHVSRLI